MLSAAAPSAPVWEPHLYDIVAHGNEVRLSPTCAEGHAMVMEIIERGFFNHMRGPRAGGAEDSDDVLARLFGEPSKGATGPIVVQRDQDEPSSFPPNADPSPQETAAVPTASNTLTAVAAPSENLLSELTKLHLRNLSRGPKKATPPGRARDYALNLLRDVIGDKPVDTITPEDAETFADALAVWPVRLKFLPEFHHMSAVNIAAKAKREKRQAIQRGTQHKHIMGVSAFFNWLVNDLKLIDENPFRYIQTSRYRDRVPKKKDIFSVQDLEAIFAPQHFRRFTEPHKYWVPLIAFFSGMRVNEISQLYVDDVEAETVMDETGAKRKILYFHITPYRDGQSIKTPYSMRRIPVHSKLLELGFERYLADVRATGAVHLFPGLPWALGGPGSVASHWFNRWHLRKTCGIHAPTKTLHCFRHTLTTLAERQRIPVSVIHTINGHSDGQGIDERTYVARGSLLECQRALESLEFPPLPLEPYLSARFQAYLTHVVSEDFHAARMTDDDKPYVRRKGRPPALPAGDRPTTG